MKPKPQVFVLGSVPLADEKSLFYLLHLHITINGIIQILKSYKRNEPMIDWVSFAFFHFKAYSML